MKEAFFDPRIIIDDKYKILYAIFIDLIFEFQVHKC